MRTVIKVQIKYLIVTIRVALIFIIRLGDQNNRLINESFDKIYGK